MRKLILFIVLVGLAAALFFMRPDLFWFFKSEEPAMRAIEILSRLNNARLEKNLPPLETDDEINAKLKVFAGTDQSREEVIRQVSEFISSEKSLDLQALRLRNVRRLQVLDQISSWSEAFQDNFTHFFAYCDAKQERGTYYDVYVVLAEIK